MSDTTNSLPQSQGGPCPEGSLRARQNLPQQSQMLPLRCHQPYPGRDPSRTPSGGWSGAPVGPPAIPQNALPAILAAATGAPVHGLQQLPFPGFPPVNYQPAGLSSCGIPGCRTTSGSVSYHARPALSCDRDRFTEIRDEPQPRRVSSQSSVAESASVPRGQRSTSQQSRGRRVSFSESDGETDSGVHQGRQRPHQRQQMPAPKPSCRVFKTGVRADSE